LKGTKKEKIGRYKDCDMPICSNCIEQCKVIRPRNTVRFKYTRVVRRNIWGVKIKKTFYRTGKIVSSVGDSMPVEEVPYVNNQVFGPPHVGSLTNLLHDQDEQVARAQQLQERGMVEGASSSSSNSYNIRVGDKYFNVNIKNILYKLNTCPWCRSHRLRDWHKNSKKFSKTKTRQKL
jgi:hypothetical protein